MNGRRTWAMAITRPKYNQMKWPNDVLSQSL